MKTTKSDSEQIRSITVWGIGVNIFLSIIKVIGGILIHSMALIADGIHSLSDLVTDVAVLISSRAARRPPDYNHPYGHGKFETMGAQLIALILLIVGGSIGWSALHSLYDHHQYFLGPFVVIIAFVSVVAKEVLFQYTRKIAQQVHSSSLFANAWHHRSDALSSVAVIFGGVLSLFGFGYGDQLAGLIVGMMVIAVAVKIIIENVKELSEHAIDDEIIQFIKTVLKNHGEVNHWHKLRTRKIGSELFIDVHIQVNPDLSVYKSHKFTKDIEHEIQKNCVYPVNVLIHVEPFMERNEKKAIRE